MSGRPKDWAISREEARALELASVQRLSEENRHLREILRDVRSYADRKGTFGFSELHNILARVEERAS